MVEARFTSVVITWSPPQEPNGVIIAYEVTYYVHGRLSIENTTNIATTLTLNLAKNVVSNISVRAYTSVGPGRSVNFSMSTPCEFTNSKK